MDARLNFDSLTRAIPLVVRPADASGALVKQHSKLVAYIARSVFVRTSTSMPVEDLFQIGVIALLEAARVFEDRGVALFTTYAATRIRGAMLDELRRSATLSRQAMRNRRDFATTRARLSAQLGQLPSDGEMATELAIPVTAYRAAVAATQGLRYESIDAAYSDHSSWFADAGPDASEVLEQNKRSQALAAAIAAIPAREGMILQLYFVEELSLEEIGQVLNISGPRVCQIKRTALARVKRRLHDWQ